MDDQVYSGLFCKVYNEFGWNYYPEIFGQQLLQWLKNKDLQPKTAMDLACGTGILCRALDEAGIELIVLAGFMCILSEAFTSRYPKRILNVHPSLIPSFCGEGFFGLRVHEAALSYGVKVTGATVHYVNEVADGGEIILQKAVAIEEGDTPEILQKRVMEKAEWILLPEAAELVSRKIREEA